MLLFTPPPMDQMKKNIFRVRCAARMYARARGGEANGRKADEGRKSMGGTAPVPGVAPPPSEGNSCSAPPTLGRGIIFPSMESAIKNSLWVPHMRKYRSVKIKRNEFPSLSGMNQRGKGVHKRRSMLYHSIGSDRSEMSQVLILLNKYQRDMSFIKLIFLANCVIMVSLILGSVHLFWGDSMNKYVLSKVEKLLTEVKNSSRTQTIIKGMVNDLLYSIVNDEKNKNITAKFVVDTLQSSKTEMGNVFTDVLQTEQVRNNLRNVFMDISNYLCNNDQVQTKVYHLLAEAIHLPIAIETSKKWLNDLFKSESVTSNVRKVIRDEIFNNEQVLNNSVLFVQNALFNAMQDKKTKEMSELFFSSLLSNPEFQQQISGSLWKIVKLALSPKWMTYEGDHLNFKVSSQIQNKRDEIHMQNPLLDGGNNHLGTISCDVLRDSDDVVEEASTKEDISNRGELLPLGRNMGSAHTGRAPLEKNPIGDVVPEAKEVMSEMRHVIDLFENTQIFDGHTDVTECEQTYVGQLMQTDIGRNLTSVDMEHLEDLRTFVFPPPTSENNFTTLSAIPVCKVRSLKEGGGHLTSLKKVNEFNGFYFDNRIDPSHVDGCGEIPSGKVLPCEVSLGKTSSNHDVTNYAPSSNHEVIPANGIAVRVKFFLLDAYRFYTQKYYFYYYYVERVKAVLQRALGVKFF
ncbi:conserved Plasmodium protein, unknown function [Plasmodium knowlesi strain H]|uniref:Uncharacterized protein n=3 Tax=Plasmodium knowlesi TaxID=5850 RepID=A0A5K1UW29_PLAKH|nr:conserved protein, unknown function [Plasmodium knowlesi strain H]OTN68066.1 Uncharacterized protein PKNOH_S04355300 [Plasmodium knowlesi]CAA9986918.1 conserved protein, unknown function [Plasmodium knowlesi strain H]SBO26514.1 conserved Plasmodium protein, unknown function [Plasmodium knowlesi strain H]SBO28122.1 conserved Plasmodium protein, unknown function [Plasmodium knowlesi strain H]VVS76392.1 conserved protein, unknown function [Plasmodium knowlesi strain H]|eukprot:XP_002258165.1 hypothetical protein, conserved in Plasmodium species [Plasmodium knowlesi strain H]